MAEHGSGAKYHEISTTASDATFCRQLAGAVVLPRCGNVVFRDTDIGNSWVYLAAGDKHHARRRPETIEQTVGAERIGGVKIAVIVTTGFTGAMDHVAVRQACWGNFFKSARQNIECTVLTLQAGRHS